MTRHSEAGRAAILVRMVDALHDRLAGEVDASVKFAFGAYDYFPAY